MNPAGLSDPTATVSTRRQQQNPPHRPEEVQYAARGFALGDQTGVLITRVPLPAKTSSNAAVNLLSRSRMRNLNRPACPSRSIRRLRACWAVQAPGRMGGDAQDVHGAGLDLHHEQDVKALEQHGVHVHECAARRLLILWR